MQQTWLFKQVLKCINGEMCAVAGAARGRGQMETERGLVPSGVTTQLTAGKCAKIHNKLGQVEN